MANATDSKLTRPLDTKKIMSAFTLCGITDATHLNLETRNMIVSGGGGMITYQDGWDASMFKA